MTYDELMKNLERRFGLQAERNVKESQAVERHLLTLMEERIRWWKPWRMPSVLRNLRKAASLFGQNANTAVSELQDLRQTQLDTLQVQKKQQEMLSIMKDRLKKLEEQ